MALHIMSLKTFFGAALLAVASQGAFAAAQPLTLQAQGTGYSAGLSTQAGSTLVTHTQAGEFRDEFLIRFSGPARLNAWLDTSADLSLWASQGITFQRAGFLGVDGAELTFDITDLAGTRFTYGEVETFVAVGDFIFFVEGVAGDPSVQQTAAQARLNSFSYSGGINLEAVGELPEPASLALAGLALAGAWLSTRRRPQ